VKYYSSIFVNLVKLITPIILFFLKTKITNVQGKIPSNGPLLIAAHHEELADQYIINAQIKRRLFWVADTTPFGVCLADTFFIKWLMLKLGAIPIDKRNPKRNVNLFCYLVYLLGKGEAIVFFPESYIRSEREGKRFGEFKDGIVRLALEYEKRFNKRIPIYPIGLCYMGKGIKKVSISIGKAFFVSNLEDKKRLFNEIKRLS